MPLKALRQELLATVLGSNEAVDLLLTSLLARGHALVTGPPGIGKTTLAQALATLLSGSYRRIQFTPDLLPSDILGYQLYRPQNGDFEFIAGPVFANFVLADEINRASPRTQSSLLEAMNERQVTIDGATRELPDPFLVIATQNDTSSTGTFPLPEPQLDRFLLSIPMGLPDDQTQLEILRYHAGGKSAQKSEPIISLEQLTQLQSRSAAISVSDTLQRYLLALCQAVRSMIGQDHAVSTRATLALQRAAQASALLDDQEAIHPDHVQKIFPHVLRHRLLTEDTPDPDHLLRAALEQTPVP
ncbi:MoxR family ATPase [bacterium]|jgi:MoxR-like ATPase|nr:MoxR family ATPase [Akkermansiaceae bacterium]MDB4488388.1 MoxR family ATPase [bacterium]MDA7929405.1 MoxR family ATPase [Akkermansiaceae bacterium]MDB4383327.1 MoxR family ATPase [Akkermansiaceae bacterium]MDB4572583.1 MoxR family ATPase [Akkermansiaceae bacterium]